MELNREKLKRMFDDAKGNGGSSNGGGGGGSLAGYATQAWVNEGFVSIDFFNRLFTVYGPGETSSDPDVVIEPNDLDSTIKNIKAMFGLWTEQYLSALGLNPGGTGSATSLSMLDDVDITTPTNGQALVYNATSLKWENQTISTVTALANLTDVTLSQVQSGQTLLYDSTTSKWYNSALKTINGQSLIGSGDISVGGGASGNYLPLTGGTLSRATTTYEDSILKVINTATHNYPRGIEIFTPNNSAFSTPLLMGKAYGTNNMCDIDFIYTGSGSTDNAMSLGFYGNDNLIYLKANGNVGIGTTSPSSKLHVDGTITSTTYPCIRYFDGATTKMNLGYYPTGGYSYFSNETNKWEIRIYDNGNLNYAKWDTGTVYNIWHSGNFNPNDYVTLSTAQTITGVKTLTPTISSSSNSVVYMNNTYSGSYARCINITFANQPTSGFNTPFLFGKSDAKNNKGTIDFGYVGNQSNSNYVGIGFYANDNIFVVTGGGNVGIGTTTPAAPLDVMNNNGDMIRLQTTDASYCCINYCVPNSSELWSVGTRNDIFYFYNSNYSNILHVIKRNGYVGILTTSPSYALHVVGSIYATGAITALSDIKQKNIKEYMQLGIDDVANAPIIKFTWKDPKAEDKGLQVGSIAQYWEKVLPEAVKKDKEGTLSMSYGVVALVAAISTAKKVRELDERVTKLEKIER